jgi:predicted DNA-binding transcriptional regulator YafY/transposase
MDRMFRKRDRTARLLKLQVLLWQYPKGIEIEEIARRCSISKRTAYRDLEALDSELGVPIWEDGTKRGISEGHFLPPITFTQSEAISVLLAARMLQHFSPQYNSSIASAFLKLSSIVQPFLKNQIQNTIRKIEKMPADQRKLNNFDSLIQAWLSGHPVKIWYQELYALKPIECTIEPYFIEPTPRNRSNYVIGYCRLTKSIKTFKLDRIIGEVKTENDSYEIPSDFNIDDYLSSAWGPYADKGVEVVKLRFSKDISHAIAETRFHPSQVTESQSDGSLLMTVKVNNTGDFQAWILGWGKDVEVLEPSLLRDQISLHVQSLCAIYDINKRQLMGHKAKPIEAVSELGDISDEQWNSILPLLPLNKRTGRPRADDRKTLNGIHFVLKSGIRWNALPRRYGASSTCFTRFHQWKKWGIWDNIWKMLSTNKGQRLSE